MKIEYVDEYCNICGRVTSKVMTLYTGWRRTATCCVCRNVESEDYIAPAMSVSKEHKVLRLFFTVDRQKDYFMTAMVEQTSKDAHSVAEHRLIRISYPVQDNIHRPVIFEVISPDVKIDHMGRLAITKQLNSMIEALGYEHSS